MYAILYRAIAHKLLKFNQNRSGFLEIRRFIFWGKSEWSLFLKLECLDPPFTVLWGLNSSITKTSKIRTTVQVLSRQTSLHTHRETHGITKITLTFSGCVKPTESRDTLFRLYIVFSYTTRIWQR
jgi:hypothetical protein